MVLTFFRLHSKALAASSPAGYEVRCILIPLYYSFIYAASSAARTPPPAQSRR